jgi:tRNA(fMet)-specific endonuclease VapC
MAVSRICLDTSAYSHFMRGKVSAVAAISAAKWVGIPTVVLGELRTGFLLGGQAAKNEEELDRFLNHPLVQILDVDDSASRFFAEIVAMLRRSGTPLPTNDIWIASVAAREGATVVSYDEHFQMIHRIGSYILSD